MELASFADLDDALLEQVALHLPLEDLCRACRVCSRLRAVIMGAQEVWRSLFEATYGSSSGGGSGGGGRGSAGAAAGTGQQVQQQQQSQQQGGLASRQDAPASQAIYAAASRGQPPGSALASAPPLDSIGSNTQLGKRRREGSSSGNDAAAAQAAAAAAAAAGLESSSWRERFKDRWARAVMRPGRCSGALRPGMCCA